MVACTEIRVESIVRLFSIFCRIVRYTEDWAYIDRSLDMMAICFQWIGRLCDLIFMILMTRWCSESSNRTWRCLLATVETGRGMLDGTVLLPELTFRDIIAIIRVSSPKRLDSCWIVFGDFHIFQSFSIENWFSLRWTIPNLPDESLKQGRNASWATWNWPPLETHPHPIHRRDHLGVHEHHQCWSW